MKFHTIFISLLLANGPFDSLFLLQYYNIAENSTESAKYCTIFLGCYLHVEVSVLISSFTFKLYQYSGRKLSSFITIC